MEEHVSAIECFSKRKMKMSKNIKIKLERVQRTDLICVSCGNFRTEWAIVPAPDGEPVSGVHTKCISMLRVTRAKKTAAVVID
jgi:hypothetical protein